MAIPDEELVGKALAGDEDAFRLLYEKYRTSVFTAAYRILLDYEEPRDATQDIFITIYRSLTKWNPKRARFLPWIYKIATNRAIDLWRVKQRLVEIPLTKMSEMPSSPYREELRSPEKNVENKERQTVILRLLDSLPDLQRRFIVMRFYEGLKLREIAEKEGFKLGTVKVVLHRAIKAMRSNLSRLHKNWHVNFKGTPMQDLALGIYEN